MDSPSNSMPTKETTSGGGHQLSPMDPDSPMQWGLMKKLYTSSVAFFYAFVILYGTTTYTAAVAGVAETFKVSMHIAILGYTLPFFGVFFAPIYTPHLAELFGRRPIYLYSIPLYTLCVVVIGLASNIHMLLAFRFLAGFFGGPSLVLIEGTFADIWSAEWTVTYYTFITLAQVWGAAFGPIIGGYVFTSKGPAWLSWVAVIFAAASLAYGCAMPETYGRAILRERIRYNRSNIKLPDAQSGTTISSMAHITIASPLKMLVAEPIVIMACLYLGLIFALMFQWFISVPVVLNMVYGFSLQRAGLAFFSAVGGGVMAVVSSSLIEAVTSRNRGTMNMAPIETRLIPGIVGSLLCIGSLFWIGYTADPEISFYSPIFGTGVYVWGGAMGIISIISYLFDAYPPAGTLSALTAAACFRLASAGIVPIFILDMITDLQGKWAFGTFGFVSVLTLTFPVVLFFIGDKLRAKSKYSRGGMTVREAEIEMMHLEPTNGAAMA